MTRDAAGEMSIVIDDIRDIARDVIGAATDHAAASKSSFANVGVGVGDFSTVPMARELALQHKAAHEVFRETIDGVLSDLEEFRTQLLACADGHEATDDSVRAALSRMSSRYQHRELHSKRNYDHGRREQGRALDPQHTGESANQDSGSHEGGTHHSTEGHGGESFR